GAKRLAVDLVVLNGAADAAALAPRLEAAIEAAKRARPRPAGVPGGVFLIRADTLPAASRELFHTAARAIFTAAAPVSEPPPEPPRPEPAPRPRLKNLAVRAEALGPLPALEFFNGLGGFAAGGREYVAVLQEGAWTPAPWVNVIANAEFGVLVSADAT